MAAVTVGAIDLGATSGRVMAGRVGPNTLEVHEVHRFENVPVELPDGLHWNLLGLYQNVLSGLRDLVAGSDDIVSVAVDSWGVDYGLLSEGRLLGVPFHYRDGRTARGVRAVHEKVPAAELYERNGLQHLPFNTIFQLAAEELDLENADSFLLVPDLLGYWLTGVARCERTNASTTGLLAPHTGTWDFELAHKVGLPSAIFGDFIDAGERLGEVRSAVASEIGLSAGLDVVAVGSHDTASAVVGVPATTQDFAYISCGTWGLVGVEVDEPVISQAGRESNFTNERGVDGKVRYLHNVMGLWLLSETIRVWNRDSGAVDLAGLIEAAAAEPAGGPTFDTGDSRFLPPGDMPDRIRTWLAEHNQVVPGSQAALARCILESLAKDFASAVRTAAELSGKSVEKIHLVGGGSLNTLLCQLTADYSELPVFAGPVEATALGNIILQARSAGSHGSLESARSLIATTYPPVVYKPRLNTSKPQDSL